ncbi:hypothetical protein NQ318_013187, partial [Aromia moschata]
SCPSAAPAYADVGHCTEVWLLNNRTDAATWLLSGDPFPTLEVLDKQFLNGLNGLKKERNDRRRSAPPTAINVKKTGENIEKNWRRPDLWKIHQDNTLAHSALSVKSFFCKKYGITVLENPPYSLDLASCDFLFPKVKSALKGTRFESVEAVKVKATVLNQPTETDFQHCFQQWKSLWGSVEIAKGSTLKAKRCYLQ